MSAVRAGSLAVRRLGEVMEETAIDASGIARILDKDPKTVQRWLRHGREPQWEVRETLLVLNVVLERLAEVIEPSFAEDWLFTPVPALDYRRPVELIRDGDYLRVLNLIDSIGEGVFA
jgi:putative toxin-antitoxin system antitoxin component (TIGR02293 family)